MRHYRIQRKETAKAQSLREAAETAMGKMCVEYLGLTAQIIWGDFALLEMVNTKIVPDLIGRTDDALYTRLTQDLKLPEDRARAFVLESKPYRVVSPA